MKQKSILWSMLATIMVAMLSIGFAACDDDDGDNKHSVFTFTLGYKFAL